MGLGLLLLADLVYRAQDLDAFHTDAGVLPRPRLARLAGESWRLWSLHTLGGSAAFEGALFGIQALVAIAVLTGFRTRIATALSWVLLVSLQHRNPLILTGADQVLRAMLLWACFVPLGACWSVDARKGTGGFPRHADPWCCIPLLAQIPLLYGFSVIFKLRSESWTGLTAFAELSRVEGVATDWARALGSHMDFASASTGGALALECLGPLLAFSPWGTARLRIAVVAAFVLFHAVGIGSTMRLGLMPGVMAVFWLPLLPSAFWDRGRAEIAPLASSPRPVVAALAISLFAVTVAENVRSLGRHRVPLPLGLASVSDTFALQQRWQLWDRPIANRYYVVAATLPDGEEVDLLTQRPLDWSHPARHAPNNHWWKLQLQLSAPAGETFREDYVRALARAWVDEGAGNAWPESARLVLLDARLPANPATLPRRTLWSGPLGVDTDV